MRTRAKIEDELAKVNARIENHKRKIQERRKAGERVRFKAVPSGLLEKWYDLNKELEACPA